MSVNLLSRPPRLITVIVVDADTIARYEGEPPLIGETIRVADAHEPASPIFILRVASRALHLITEPNKDPDAYWICGCQIEDR